MNGQTGTQFAGTQVFRHPALAEWDRLQARETTAATEEFYDPDELQPDPRFEFICTSCNLVAHVSGRTQTVCRDCVSTLGGSK